MDRYEIRERLENVSLNRRFPRSLTIAQRRRNDMIKQWSMDDTQTWFYSRSPSLDRPKFPTTFEDGSENKESAVNSSTQVLMMRMLND